VVDYIGVAHELKQALKEYTASKGRDRPTVDAHETYAVLTKNSMCCTASITENS
jgi:type I restriction enzyme, R subunit